MPHPHLLTSSCPYRFDFPLFQDFDDKQEKFDQSQQAFLLNFPDSASFYNAKVYKWTALLVEK